MPVVYNPFTRNYDFTLPPGHTHDQYIVDWKESVLSKTVAYGAAVSSGTNRYISPTTSGSWIQDNIYQWDESAWAETSVSGNEGVAVFVEDVEKVYVYSGGVWVLLGTIIEHHNLLGLSDDDHPHYTKQAVFASHSGSSSIHFTEASIDKYTQSEVTTISGDIVAQIGGGTSNPLEVGTPDTTKGELYLYSDGGASISGGQIRLYTAPNYDVQHQYYGMRVEEDDLLIGSESDPDALRITNSGNIVMPVGALTVGTNNTQLGAINLHGHSSGNDGGRILIFTAAAHDDTIDKFWIQAYNDDLMIGHSPSYDSLVLDGGTGVWNFNHAGGVNIAGDLTVASGTTPTSAGDTGTQGEIRWTDDYIYVCVATDTWKRSAITTW